MSAAVSAPATLLDELENWPADPHAFDQAIKAAITLFEAMRPEGEFEPAGEIDVSAAISSPRGPLDLEDLAIPPLAWGHNVAYGLLRAIVQPETVGPILKRLGSTVSEKLGPESVARIQRRVAPAEGGRK